MSNLYNAHCFENRSRDFHIVNTCPSLLRCLDKICRTCPLLVETGNLGSNWLVPVKSLGYDSTIRHYQRVHNWGNLEISYICEPHQGFSYVQVQRASRNPMEVSTWQRWQHVQFWQLTNCSVCCLWVYPVDNGAAGEGLHSHRQIKAP